MPDYEIDKRIEKLEKLADQVNDEQKSELAYLKSKRRIEDLKDNIKKSDSFLRDLYSTNSPKKDAIQKWAEELELQFNYEKKHEIPTVVKSVGSISSYIKLEMKTLGVSESIYSYVHHVLMFKYKGDDIHANNLREKLEGNDSPQDSSLNTNYGRENEPLLEILCGNQQIVLDKRKKIYESFPVLSQMTPDERLRHEAILLNIQATQLIELQSYDNRQKVPKFYQQFLFGAFMVQTNNEASSLYWTNVKLHQKKEDNISENMFAKSSKFALEFLPEKTKNRFIKTMQEISLLRKEFSKIIAEKAEDKFTIPDEDGLTSKQAMKFVNGFVPEMIEIHNPKNRDEAINRGMYGIACPNCGEWRVERKMHDDHTLKCLCHSCGIWFEAKNYPICNSCRLPFYDVYIQIMEIKAKEKDEYHTLTECPRCKTEVTFDKKLMEKVVIVRSP
jgi:hypothetical protein